MKNRIKKEDYYGNMYDIEALTDLNRKGAKRKNDSDVRKIEKLIVRNSCNRARNELRALLVGNGSYNPRLEVLNGALWTKGRLFSNLAGFDFENLSPKNCALEELSGYLKRPKKEIEQKMLVEKPVAEAWKKMNPDPDVESEVDDFYMKTDAYIFELMAANNIVQTLYSFYVLCGKLNGLNVGTILDYGAGAGTLSILFKNLGYGVIYADLPGKLFNFAKWRFGKRKLQIPMVDLKKEKVGMEYDCIVCTEVIEHVTNPKALLRIFRDGLKKNDILVISESCEYTEDFSSHLERNKKYGGKNFIRLMRSFGFEQIVPEPFIPQMIFRRI